MLPKTIEIMPPTKNPGKQTPGCTVAFFRNTDLEVPTVTPLIIDTLLTGYRTLTTLR